MKGRRFSLVFLSLWKISQHFSSTEMILCCAWWRGHLEERWSWRGQREWVYWVSFNLAANMLLYKTVFVRFSFPRIGKPQEKTLNSVLSNRALTKWLLWFSKWQICIFPIKHFTLAGIAVVLSKAYVIYWLFCCCPGALSSNLGLWQIVPFSYKNYKSFFFFFFFLDCSVHNESENSWFTPVAILSKIWWIEALSCSINSVN